MISRFASKLNEQLMEAFNSVRKIEENSLREAHNHNVSSSEYNFLSSVAKSGDAGAIISRIAADLDITLASVTVGVNKLVTKGFLMKEKIEGDGRLVYVKLTRDGKKIVSGHRYFHENIVRYLTKDFNEEELSILLVALSKLNNFFKRNNYFYKKKMLKPDAVL